MNALDDRSLFALTKPGSSRRFVSPAVARRFAHPTPAALARLTAPAADALTFASLRGYWVEIRPHGKPHIFKPGFCR